MNSIDRTLIRSVGVIVAKILMVFFLCKISGGLFVAVLVGYGIWAASVQKLGDALSCYVLMPLLTVANPYLVSIGGVGTAILRLGFIAMTISLMLAAGRRRGGEQIPLGLLWLYVFVSVFSSIGGYAPLISFLKIINFSMFLCGIWLGMRNLDRRFVDVRTLRRFLLSIICVVICGSLALAFILPGTAYFNSLQYAIQEYGVDAINSQGLQRLDGMVLLSGITNQSQCLAPLSAVSAIWVLCDMLFVEKRLSILHCIVLLCAVPLVYMTRSRCALLSSCVGVAVVFAYGMRYATLERRVRGKLMSGLILLCLGVGALAVVMEAKNHTISKWVRKSENVKSDERSITEAFTQSRMGLVETNMADFRRNPLLGSGFQVEYEFQYRYPKNAIVLSAPIEKGVLPLMILGETGIVGALVFLVFVVVFYVRCTQKRYIATAILFTVFLTANLGEAIFFSTGGPGGVCWVVSIVGGFAIDMIMLDENRMRRRLQFSYYRSNI